MKVCNRFLSKEGGWARSVVYQPKAYGCRVYPQDAQANDREAETLWEEADVIILTSYMGPEHARGKPYSRHYSTEPFRWHESVPDPLRSHVVAQYQARFAPKLDVLPNVIPIDDAMFMPGEKDDDLINIVYTPTSRTLNGWSRKSYPDVMFAFRRLLNDIELRSKIRIYLLEDTPFEQVMIARQRAHIVIDEVSTGSYHSTTLEGLSCGAAVIGRIDNETQLALNRLFNEEMSLPVFQSGEKSLYNTLRLLVDNRMLLRSTMKENRKWMQKNYSERWQAEKWINWHREFLKT